MSRFEKAEGTNADGKEKGEDDEEVSKLFCLWLPRYYDLNEGGCHYSVQEWGGGLLNSAYLLFLLLRRCTSTLHQLTPFVFISLFFPFSKSQGEAEEGAEEVEELGDDDYNIDHYASDNDNGDDDFGGGDDGEATF